MVVSASEARPGPAGLCLPSALIKRRGEKPWNGHIRTARGLWREKLLNRHTCLDVRYTAKNLLHTHTLTHTQTAIRWDFVKNTGQLLLGNPLHTEACMFVC